ncbi:MAG: plasmid pRiA4b ORF-3 family protein [Bacilli bacterium]
MQIALTKKLADALAIKPLKVDETIDPLFTWTANWMKVWNNRRADDLLVLVNNATRFTVAIYEVKRKDLKNIEKIIKNAIENTLLAHNINPEIVSEYVRQAGEFSFTRNNNRKTTAWLNRAGIECENYVATEYNGIDKMYCDTIGYDTNNFIVNTSGNGDDAFYPYQMMIEKLEALTSLPGYKYQALELLISLDLEVYKAERRIIVPSNMEFSRLHDVLQMVLDWKDYHLYDFIITDEKTNKEVVRLVSCEEDLYYDSSAVLMHQRKLSEFLPSHKEMLYTYDFGDNWKHHIQIVRVIEDYNQESPYLIDANGQTPPEDVGGVYGFIRFLEIINDPTHPEHTSSKQWAGLWQPELSEWMKKPRLVNM